MTEPLDRDDVIRLLDLLGSDEDVEVLEAARDLHAQITAAELDWDELLMPDASVNASDTDDIDETDDTADTADTAETAGSHHSAMDGTDEAPSAGKKGRDAESLTLIETLLSDSDRSDALREELEEYKADIAQGEFGAKDHQYVRALHKRLTK